MTLKETIIAIGQIIGVALSIFLISYFVFSWTGPTTNPPNGNVDAPLSSGSDTGYKAGALGVGGVFQTDTHTHLAKDGGNVGIGTTSPEAKLEVNGDMKVTGEIYGWTVPTDVKITSASHNGNFGGYAAMNAWIQDNGCAGYHVCDVYEVGRWEMMGGTMAKNNAWACAYAWHHHADAQRDCEGWSSSSSSYRGMRFNGAGPGTDYLFGSSTCSNTRPVLCCKY